MKQQRSADLSQAVAPDAAVPESAGPVPASPDQDSQTAPKNDAETRPAASARKKRKRPKPPPNQIRDIPRRLVLGSLTLAAATTAFRTNIAVDYLLTESERFRVTTPDNEENQRAANNFPGKTWYLLGGFGVSYLDTGRKLAALQPAMNLRAPASYIGYSNTGIDISQLFIAVQRDIYERKIDTIYFYGDSFGGMAAVVLGGLLTKIGVTVKIIVMGSSPSSVNDVRTSNAQYISVAGEIVPYLGVVGRLGAGILGGITNPNGLGMYEAAKSGLNSTLNNSSNSLILNTTQATFLQAFPSQYDGGIPRTTGIGLMYDPEDFIVDAPRAIDGWQRMFPLNPSLSYSVPHTGHASPELNTQSYVTGLEVIIDKLDPLPLTSKPIRPIF